MRRRIRWWGWLLLGVPVLVPAAALLLLHSMMNAWEPRPLAVAFAGRPLPRSHTLDLRNGRRLHYGETGPEGGPLVVLIHGTPGRWEDFFDVMKRPELADHARLVAVDRPGWGGSSAGGLEPSLAAQAAAIAALLRTHPENRPAVVVGHSLGGAVAPRVAMDFPDLVDGLVLVAASIDPALEETTWYQALARSVLVRWAIPEPLTRSDDELVPFRRELQAMSPRWGEVRCPVVVVQGDEDELVPAGNADFAARVLPHAAIERIPGQGHLIPWQRPDLITKAVLQVIRTYHGAHGSARRPGPSAARAEPPGGGADRSVGLPAGSVPDRLRAPVWGHVHRPLPHVPAVRLHQRSRRRGGGVRG